MIVYFSEAAIALNDSVENVLAILKATNEGVFVQTEVKKLDDGEYKKIWKTRDNKCAYIFAVIERRALLPLASAYNLRPRFAPRPNETRALNELEKEAADLKPQ